MKEKWNEIWYQLKSMRVQLLLVMFFIGLVPVVLFSIIFIRTYNGQTISQKNDEVKSYGNVISNLIVMTCLACMMNVVLEKCNNLALSMLMHFAFNFPYCFLQAGSLFYLVLSAVFLLLAAGFCAGRKK